MKKLLPYIYEQIVNIDWCWFISNQWLYIDNVCTRYVVSLCMLIIYEHKVCTSVSVKLRATERIDWIKKRGKREKSIHQDKNINTSSAHKCKPTGKPSGGGKAG